MRYNNITPLTNIDFAASIAELKPLLTTNLVALPPATEWSELYYIMASANDLPITSNTLAELNLEILNLYYVERQSSPDYYEESVPHCYIILPLVETEEIATIASAYSAPLNSTRLPDNPNLYDPEDCTLLKKKHLRWCPVVWMYIWWFLYPGIYGRQTRNKIQTPTHIALASARARATVQRRLNNTSNYLDAPSQTCNYSTCNSYKNKTYYRPITFD